MARAKRSAKNLADNIARIENRGLRIAIFNSPFSIFGNMPEFPDVTVYIEALAERVLNQPIQKIRIGSPFVLRSFDPPIGAAEGKKVLALRRLGKRIVFALEDELFLIVHLMIAGRFHWKPKGRRSPANTDRPRSIFPTARCS